MATIRYRKAFKVRKLSGGMRLQEQISREYKGAKYSKFWVVVTPRIVAALGWKKGQRLKGVAKGGKLVIEGDDSETKPTADTATTVIRTNRAFNIQRSESDRVSLVVVLGRQCLNGETI